MKDWLYEYDWRYELRSRKATVIETQWVFNDDRTNAIGEREYSVFEGTENQAREYIRLRSNAFRSVRGSSRLGCPAACQSRWKWIDLNDDEMLFEANGEIGFHFNQHLLLGAGIDFQHFGEFGESKASSWTFYLATGIVF